jgi:hypothetical protein
MYKTPTFEERFEYKEKNKALDKEILEIDKKLPVENWSLGMKESFIECKSPRRLLPLGGR